MHSMLEWSGHSCPRFSLIAFCDVHHRCPPGLHSTAMLPINLGIAIVRRLEEPDKQAYLALEKDPVARFYMRGPSKKENDSLWQSVTQLSADDVGVLAIAEPVNNSYIGRCGLLECSAPEESELYCMLEQNYWRQGIGEVVILFLQRLAYDRGKRAVGIVHPENTGSINLLSKIGWVQTGLVTKEGWQLGHLRYGSPSLAHTR